MAVLVQIRLKEPMILGHEVSGIIEALGEGVEGLKLGDSVAVSLPDPIIIANIRKGLV